MTASTDKQPVRYMQKDNIEATRLDDEWLLLNPDLYTVTTLNGTGGICWSCLREAQTIDSLIRAMDAEYDLNGFYEDVARDLEDFLTELIRCGLIESVC